MTFHALVLTLPGVLAHSATGNANGVSRGAGGAGHYDKAHAAPPGSSSVPGTVRPVQTDAVVSSREYTPDDEGIGSFVIGGGRGGGSQYAAGGGVGSLGGGDGFIVFDGAGGYSDAPAASASATASAGSGGGAASGGRPKAAAGTAESRIVEPIMEIPNTMPDELAPGAPPQPTERKLTREYEFRDGEPAVVWDKSLEQCQGELDFMMDILTDFVSESADNVRLTIEAALNFLRFSARGVDLDYPTALHLSDEIQRPSHAIKGAASTLAVMPLSEAAKVVERSLKDASLGVKRPHPDTPHLPPPDTPEHREEMRKRIVEALESVCVGRDSPIRHLIFRLREFADWVMALKFDEMHPPQEVPEGWNELSQEKITELLGKELVEFEKYEALYADA